LQPGKGSAWIRPCRLGNHPNSIIKCIVPGHDLEVAIMRRGPRGFWIGTFKGGQEFETEKPNIVDLLGKELHKNIYITK
jgi:hypothetical protein